MRDRVTIDSPCHESWDAMEGDAARRFCGVCSKHVHDLSAMNVDDADQLLRASAGQELCVRYQAEPDGSLRFRDLVPRSRLTRGLVRTAFAASILAACMPQDRVPVVDVGQSAIASAFQQPLTGGCDLSPNPAVTFHLPPGHFLCALTGDVAATDLPLAPLAAPPPAIPPPPAHDPPPAYAPPAYVPPQQIASAPPPVTRAPHRDHYQPYAPGFAPPPPPARAPYDVPPRHDFAPPPPPPQPFPGPGFAPPPPDPFPGNHPTPIVAPPPPPQPRPEPLMGSISVPEPKMGRRAPTG